MTDTPPNITYGAGGGKNPPLPRRPPERAGYDIRPTPPQGPTEYGGVWGEDPCPKDGTQGDPLLHGAEGDRPPPPAPRTRHSDALPSPYGPQPPPQPPNTSLTPHITGLTWGGGCDPEVVGARGGARSPESLRGWGQPSGVPFPGVRTLSGRLGPSGGGGGERPGRLGPPETGRGRLEPSRKEGLRPDVWVHLWGGRGEPECRRTLTAGGGGRGPSHPTITPAHSPPPPLPHPRWRPRRCPSQNGGRRRREQRAT